MSLKTLYGRYKVLYSYSKAGRLRGIKSHMQILILMSYFFLLFFYKKKLHFILYDSPFRSLYRQFKVIEIKFEGKEKDFHQNTNNEGSTRTYKRMS